MNREIENRGSIPSYNDEIDLKELLQLIVRKWWFVTLFMILFAAIGFTYSYSSYEPVFVADASMVINSKQIKVQGGEVTLTNDIYLSQKMVNTYQVILLSDSVLELVNQEMETDFNLDVMRRWIKVSSPKDTEVIMVEVTHSDAEIAVAIANAMMKEAPDVISRTIEVGSINVMDYAKLPDNPIANKYPMNTAIGGVLGMMLGLFVLLGMQFLFPKVKNRDEVSNQLFMEVLGEIPRGNFEEGAVPLMNAEQADVHFSEAFRMLGLNIRHVAIESDIKKILVTSATAKEGKTTVSMNLALTIAKSGRKVLLFDCDMYKPSILKRLGYERKEFNCIAAVISGTLKLKDCLVVNEELGIDIFSSGFEAKHSSEILGSDEMRQFLNMMEKAYDYIIIDTPPAYILSDAISLSRHCDGVVMVIRQDQTTTEVLNDTKRSFQRVGANILGVILNDIRHSSGDYRYHYKYNYNYKGGYGKSKLEKPSRIKKIFAWILLAAWLVIVGLFAIQNGETIVELSENYVAKAVEKSTMIGMLEGSSANIIEKSASISNYDAEIDYWVSMMEHYIHAILFFMGTLLSLFALRSTEIKPVKALMISLAFLLSLAVGNEVFQSRFVEGRVFEVMDVTFSILGMSVATITWWLKQVLMGSKRTEKTRINKTRINKTRTNKTRTNKS